MGKKIWKYRIFETKTPFFHAKKANTVLYFFSPLKSGEKKYCTPFRPGVKKNDPTSREKYRFFDTQCGNSIFGPWARKPFFSHGKQGRNENEEIRTFSHEGFAFRFSSRGLRPSVEINGMQCPELKNVRFPHSHFDPVFRGKKAFGSEARIRLFYWGAKI
jgi:hypothetical protein